MARLWKAFVLVVALVAVACEAIPQSRYEDIVNQAIEAYNNGRPGKPLFCLVNYTVPAFQASTSSISLEFRIKETECVSIPESQPQNCNFLEDGAAPVYSYPDYPMENVYVDGQHKDHPLNIRNIYEKAKLIIDNILRNF